MTKRREVSSEWANDRPTFLGSTVSHALMWSRPRRRTTRGYGAVAAQGGRWTGDHAPLRSQDQAIELRAAWAA